MFELQENDGHVHSLRFEGEELLFQPNGPSTDGEFYGAGWDEMLTTVEACEMDLPVYGRVFFPDHGEAWRTRWRNVFTGRALPYRFERRIAQRGAALVVEYGFTNLGPAAVPCFWAMHPVLVGTPNPPDEAVRLTQDHPRFGTAGTLAHVGPLHAGETLKYYYDRPVEEARFFSRGRRLVLSVERSDVPMYLGVWENAGGWRGHVNFSPELSTAGDDSALRARALGRLPFVSPGQTLRWTIRWQVVA
jgi:hypothetical protein